MKIFVINPNSSPEMTQGIDTSARKYVKAGTYIHTVASRGGPLAIESMADAKTVESQVKEYVAQANAENYDAIIVACYGQLTQKAAKEVSRIPVYGIAEPQLYMACFLGDKFSIIGLKKESNAIMHERYKNLGLASRCASVRTIGAPILQCVTDRIGTYNDLLREAGKAVKEDGADVICLACAGLTGLDRPMEKELGVPVLDGVVCAVKMCEAAIEYRS